MDGKKRNVLRWLAVLVIVAELAVVDYCAWMMMSNGVTIEIVSDGETE